MFFFLLLVKWNWNVCLISDLMQIVFGLGRLIYLNYSNDLFKWASFLLCLSWCCWISISAAHYLTAANKLVAKLTRTPSNKDDEWKLVNGARLHKLWINTKVNIWLRRDGHRLLAWNRIETAPNRFGAIYLNDSSVIKAAVASAAIYFRGPRTDFCSPPTYLYEHNKSGRRLCSVRPLKQRTDFRSFCYTLRRPRTNWTRPVQLAASVRIVQSRTLHARGFIFFPFLLLLLLLLLLFFVLQVSFLYRPTSAGRNCLPVANLHIGRA